MQFETLYYLYGLAAIPVLLVLFWLTVRWRKNKIAKIGDRPLVEGLMERFSNRRKFWKLILWISGFALLIIGLANLRMGSKMEKVQSERSEVVICFDVSRSMMAQDILPDRLTRAKIFTSQLIEKLNGNKIGLVVFAGKGYVQMPLTVDARASLMYVNTLSTDMVSYQGTAIGEAITIALQEFSQGGEDNSKKNRAIIIITDGETHDDNATEMAKKAAEDNIQVITVGVGTSQGAPIPVAKGNTFDYKKDEDGNIVLTKLNENMLKDLAGAGGGSYENVEGGKKAIDDIYNRIAKLEKTKGQQYEFTEYKNHFQLFLGLGLLLISIEFFLSDKKPKWIEKVKIFEDEKEK